MEFQRRRKVDSHIDMTPMIDTLLQLFVTFLLSMSFAASAVRLDLPRASASQVAPPDSITVSYDGAQQLFLNDERVSPAELQNRLPALLQKTEERKVVLRADRGLPYEKVLEVMVQIQQAGASHIRLAYDAKEGQR
jgi:biopolymer transport protein TolR